MCNVNVACLNMAFRGAQEINMAITPAKDFSIKRRPTPCTVKIVIRRMVWQAVWHICELAHSDWFALVMLSTIFGKYCWYYGPKVPIAICIARTVLWMRKLIYVSVLATVLSLKSIPLLFGWAQIKKKNQKCSKHKL